MPDYKQYIKEAASLETVRSAMLRLTKSGIRVAQMPADNMAEPDGGVKITLDFDSESNKLTAYKDNEVIFELEGSGLWKQALDYFNKQFQNGNLQKGQTQFLAKTPTTDLRDVTNQIPMAA